MSTPQNQPPAPKKRRSPFKIAGLGCLGLLALIFIIGLIGAAMSGTLGQAPEPEETTEQTQAAEATPDQTTPSATEEPEPEETTPAPAETTEAPEPTPAEETTEAEETQAPEETEAADDSPEAWAETMEAQAKTLNGVPEGGSWRDSDGCTSDPANWRCINQGATATSKGSLKVTLQIPGDDPAAEELADQAANGYLTALAPEHDDLRWVIVQDATGVVIDQKQPSDLPALGL